VDQVLSHSGIDVIMLTAFNKAKFSWVESPDPTNGVATLSLVANSGNNPNPNSPANLSGIYDIDITIDSGSPFTFTIDPTGSETMSQIAVMLDSEVVGATVSMNDNTFTFTSNSVGKNSSVVVSDTTAGINTSLVISLAANNSSTITNRSITGIETEFFPPSDWIVNPVFDDPVRAFVVGAHNWTWLNEPNIHVMTDEEIAADPVRLASNRAEMWRLIQAERDRRTQNGIKVATKWYHSDQPSRIQQLGLVIMGAGLPAGIMWKTMDGSFVEMIPTLAGQIFQATAASDQVIFGTAEYHRSQMIASADPNAYNYFTGWPLTYGE